MPDPGEGFDASVGRESGKRDIRRATLLEPLASRRGPTRGSDGPDSVSFPGRARYPSLSPSLPPARFQPATPVRAPLFRVAQPRLGDPDGYLGAGGEVEFPEDRSYMVGDGVLGYFQDVGDLPIGQPPPDEERHLALAAGEGGGWRCRAGFRDGFLRGGILRAQGVLDGLLQRHRLALRPRRRERFLT